MAIKLGILGGLLHGLAPLAGGVPDSALRPLLHGVAWCAWAGAAHFAAAGAGLTNAALPAGPAGRSAWRAGAGVAGVVAVGAMLRWVDTRSVPGADAELRMALETWPIALSAAVFVVLPAIGEEAFFRGVALRQASARFGPWTAALGSAAAFAACHPASAVAAGIFGAALAALALATGRSREAMLAHGVHNAAGLALLLAGPAG